MIFYPLPGRKGEEEEGWEEGCEGQESMGSTGELSWVRKEDMYPKLPDFFSCQHPNFLEEKFFDYPKLF